MTNICDNCWYNVFDEESAESFCDLSLDEDEYVALLNSPENQCKYFRPDTGEYGIVRKQN